MEAQTHEFSGRKSRWTVIHTVLKPWAFMGLAVAAYMASLKFPWVQTYVSNLVAEHPVTELGHWVLIWSFFALLAAIAVWLISDRKTFSYAVYFGVFGISLVVLGWRANDRFDMNDAFTQLNVLWNVIVVAVVTAAIFWIGMFMRRRLSRS